MEIDVVEGEQSLEGQFMDCRPVIVENRIIVVGGIIKWEQVRLRQLLVAPIRLAVLVIQASQPDPVIFCSQGDHITQSLPDVKPKTAGWTPVRDGSKPIGIPSFYSNLPFIPWLSRKRISIVQKFVVLREAFCRNERRVPNIIAASHHLGLRI